MLNISFYIISDQHELPNTFFSTFRNFRFFEIDGKRDVIQNALIFEA